MTAILKRLALEDSVSFLRRIVVPKWCPSSPKTASTTKEVTRSISYSTAAKIKILTPSGAVCNPRKLISQGNLVLGHASARSFAVGVEEAKEKSDTTMVRLARYMVICMMIAVGVKVVPSLGKSSVGHALMLMESEDLLFKKSGINRVRLLAKADSAALQMVEGGIAKALVTTLDECQDPETVMAALQAVEELSRLEPVREAMLLAGVKDVLQEVAMDPGENSDLARALLVCYTVQQDHMD